jgi:hypothetical protein
MSPPRIIATLDLSREIERDTQAFLKRACSGRWPLWRLLGMKRCGQVLFAATEWIGYSDADHYSLVEMSLDRPAMCWRYFPTATAACAALAALDGNHRPPTAPAAPAAATL